MAVATQTMTDEQRKSVALEYLKALDNAGMTPTGGSILDHFADDAQVMFPKWGLATGKEQIGQLFADIGGSMSSIHHHYAELTYVFSGSDVFEIRDFLIQRCFIYLDPDYAGRDTARYPWLPQS